MKGRTMNINALVKYEISSGEITTIEKNFGTCNDADIWVKQKMFRIVMSSSDIEWIEGDWESASGIGCNYSMTIR